MSGELNDLAAALCKAQAEIEGASKDSTNPHYNSKYADLASIWDACRKPLTDNGLSVVQLPSYNHDTQCVFVKCVLLHTSGQHMTSKLSAPVQKQNAQGVGSVITYLRRYTLAAMVGVAPDEDDAEASVDHSKPAERRPSYVNTKGEVVLPGAKEKWGGHGGQPIAEIKTEILSKAYNWFKKNNGDAALIEAMEEELEKRRESESLEDVPEAIKEHQAEVSELFKQEATA